MQTRARPAVVQTVLLCAACAGALTPSPSVHPGRRCVAFAPAPPTAPARHSGAAVFAWPIIRPGARSGCAARRPPFVGLGIALVELSPLWGRREALLTAATMRARRRPDHPAADGDWMCRRMYVEDLDAICELDKRSYGGKVSACSDATMSVVFSSAHPWRGL